MNLLRHSVLGLSLLLFSSTILGRDTGYALECTAVDGGVPKLFSFIEDGVEKRVRFLEVGSRTMWDSHEWNGTMLTIKSHVHAKEESEAAVTSIMNIDMDTMRASFQNTSNSADVVQMQCERWSPQIRNK